MIHSAHEAKDYYAKLMVQGKPVNFPLDTGASTSLLPVKYLNTTNMKLGPAKSLAVWNGTAKKSCGTEHLLVTNPATGRRHKVEFDMRDGHHKPSLGVTDVLRLNLVTINLSNFDRVFDYYPATTNHKS